MDKEQAILLAEETIKIIDDGGYTIDDVLFDLTTGINKSKEWTKFYEQSVVSSPMAKFKHTLVEVTTESTLQAATRLRDKNPHVGVLNFASAKNPGGGFLRGAMAQEESLARSSTLYSSLKDLNIYKREKDTKSTDGGHFVYGDWTIFSPDVIVFRNDAGDLLHKPYEIQVVTCPAPNKKALENAKSIHLNNVDAHIYFRVRMILSTFYRHNIETLVLGAWGCGVFGNNPVSVAFAFKDILEKDFKNTFKHITFAIYADGEDDVNYLVFKDML